MNKKESSRRGFLVGGGAAIAAAAIGRIDTVRAQSRRRIEKAASSPSELRQAYLLDPGVTYLNHASIGTVPRSVVDACRRYLEICESNPWLYMWGGEWDEPREAVREQAASFLGCPAHNVALTHNTTEVFNVLAQGLPLAKTDEVLFSDLNHSGASVGFEQRAERGLYRVRRFDFPRHDLAAIGIDEVVTRYAEQIRAETRALVIPHVDNVVGLRHPVSELVTMARERGVEYLLVDGAQSVGMLSIDVANLGVDCFATSPHKWLQAPKGLGLAFMAESLVGAVAPMWVTWGQKRWAGTARIFEDYGTRNLAELLALGDALAFQVELGEERRERDLKELWRYALDRVDHQAGLRWRSPRQWSMAASLFAFELEEEKASGAAARLFAKDGIVVRPFDDEGLNTLRVSPNLINTKAEIDHLLHSLQVLT